MYELIGSPTSDVILESNAKLKTSIEYLKESNKQYVSENILYKKEAKVLTKQIDLQNRFIVELTHSRNKLATMLLEYNVFNGGKKKNIITMKFDSSIFDVLLTNAAVIYDLTEQEIMSKSRVQPIPEARQTLIYILYRYTDLTLKQATNMCGLIHHTTGLHSVALVESILDNPRFNKFAYMKLMKMLIFAFDNIFLGFLHDMKPSDLPCTEYEKEFIIDRLDVLDGGKHGTITLA